MIFYDLHPIWMSVFMVVIFLVLCVSGVCLLLVVRRGRIPTGALVTLCFVLSFGMLVLYSSNMKASLFGQAVPTVVSEFSRLPLLGAGAVLTGIVMTEAVVLMQEYRFRRNTITHASIKESLDHLNTGLCFSGPNGMVMLINHRMVKLGFAILGEDIQNAALFWETLQRGEIKTDALRISGGGMPAFRLPDGSVWTFRQEQLEGAVQLTAADTTQLHRTMEQLREENRRLEAMCQRIGSYGDQVDQYVIARERLETRMNLHRFLGQALLTTRHYLQYETEAPHRILEIWQRNIDVLKLEAEPQQEPDSFGELKANAEIVGIQVTVEGCVPGEPEIVRLLAWVGVEAVINAGKHAEAKNLRIEITEQADRYIACYTNDGKTPDGDIVEGGGLGSLRAKVEYAGGTMTVSSTPRFVLTILLRKEAAPYDTRSDC